MKTRYKPTFIKDLKSLKGTSAYEKIKALVFSEIPKLSHYSEISQLSKIKGSTNAYRIRVGDYRIGCFVEDKTILFIRCLHRKDIYRFFP